MRSRKFPGTAVVLGAALTLLASGCKDSNSVAGPSTVMAPPAAASVAGTWTGTFRPDSTLCAESPATVTLEQSGSALNGTFTTGSCGVTGRFTGMVSGKAVSGKIDMLGCTGGAVNGNVNGTAVTLSVGDLTKPLVTGDEVVMYGGTLTLHR
jgi:hypothetical protein